MVIDSEAIIKGLEELYGADEAPINYDDFEDYEEYEKITERGLRGGI